MEIAILVGLGLFGMLFFAVYVGCRGLDEERSCGGDQRVAEPSRPICEPRFFAREPVHLHDDRKTPVQIVSNVEFDELIVSLEQFISQEKDAAERFVKAPSRDTLFRRVKETSWTN